MKKIFLAVFVLGFVLSANITLADVQDVKVKEGSVLYIGMSEPYTLIWGGDPEEGVESFSVYLVGGTLGDTDSKFLGTAVAESGEFEFSLPVDVRSGNGFSIQLSGRGASGGQTDNFTIKAFKENFSEEKRVILKKPIGSVIYEDQSNEIKWEGGNEIVQVGIKGQNGILGWITTNAKPNSKIYWDTKKVCDLAMTVCWDTKGLVGQYGSFKIIVVSKDKNGNMMANQNLLTGDGNYDESDDYFRISSKDNIPSVDEDSNEKPEVKSSNPSDTAILKLVTNILKADGSTNNAQLIQILELIISILEKS